jgi:hypothetical protein
MEFVHTAFQRVINESQIVSAFFYALSGFAALLVAIAITRTYANIVVNHKVDPWEMIRPMIIILVICLWKWIYMGLNEGFQGINYYFNSYLVSRVAKGDVTVIDQLFKDIGNDTSFSLMDLSMSTIVVSILNFFLGFIYWFMDMAVNLYVDINDFGLALWAPVAIIFSLLKETSGGFVTWIKMFIKFRLFMLAIIVTDFLAVLLLRYVKEEMSAALNIPATLLSVTGVSNMVNIILLSVFIVFKILFLVMSFKILSSLLQTGELGAGAAAGGIMKNLTMVTQKLATKGLK